MGHSSAIVLNEGEGHPPPGDQPIDVALTLAMADLKAEFMDPESGAVRYKAIRGSETFQRYELLARGLRSFDPRSLAHRGQRLAFWINIYNTAVIHGVVHLGLERSVKEFPRFFHRVAYDIGGQRFSLNDMEHGILRGNRRPPYALFKPFGSRDPRLELAVAPLDPRIHFALVCGARSCPPIGFYEADRVDSQLQLAAESLVNSSQVEILPQEGAILLSKIFQWYRADFDGTKAALIETILRFLDQGEKKDYLRKSWNGIKIRYKPYDWSLNA
jgi:hypothetical protein